MLPPLTVEYPQFPLDSTHVVVSPLSREEARELTPGILDLVIDAYSAEFEGEGKPLPPGKFAEKYDTGEARRYFKDTAIPRAFNQGGTYSTIRDPQKPDVLLATLKTLPGDTIERPRLAWIGGKSRFAGMVGIAEILVRPSRQGQSLGSAILHAHLLQANPNARLMLDAFEDGHRANAWYDRLRFAPEKPSGGLVIGGLANKLPTRYWVTEAGVSVTSMQVYLEARHPQLQKSIQTAEH